MNPVKFTTDLLDLLKRHNLVSEDPGQKITIMLHAPFDVHVKVEHYAEELETVPYVERI